jgi:hypothetical protein
MRNITRGFVGRNRQHDRRLPPGHYDAGASYESRKEASHVLSQLSPNLADDAPA